MIKKIFLLIIFCLFINPCFAADNYSYVSAVEQKLFNTKFQNENINKRLDRIENNVFGIKTSGNYTIRIKKLKTIFGQVEKPTLPVKTNKPAQKTANLPKIQKEDPSIKYTVVDELEKKVLNRTYIKDSIYQRLSRLEMAVFNNTVNNAPLNVRVDNLKIAVYGNDKTTKKNIAQSEQNNDLASLSDDSVKLILGKMENDVLNQTYPNDSVDSRLSRLEMKVFNSASSEDPVNDRVERLSAVISALPSNELYKDQASVRQYQDMTAKMSAAAILLLIIQGLLF